MPALVRHTVLRGVGATLIAFVLGASSAVAQIDGYFSYGGRFSDLRSTVLIPDPEAGGYETTQGYAKAVLQFRHDVADLKFAGQLRLELNNLNLDVEGAGYQARAILDELYAEYAATDALVLFAGRRNLSSGQSFGINPADVFLDDRLIDRSRSSDRQRSELEGIDMIGGEVFFPSGSSILSYWAPSNSSLNPDYSDRAYFAYRTTVGEAQADLTLFAFDDDRPGLGASFVYPTNSGMLLYVDAVARRGQNLPIVDATGAVGGLDRGAWETESTIGFSYPFANGLSLNMEYSHLSGGYGDSAWDAFTTATQANSPPTNPAQGAALARLGQIAEMPYLRRNYAFVRLYHPNVFASGLEAELTSLVGLDDGSGSVNMRFIRALGDTSSLSVSMGQTFGGVTDEFTRGVERGFLDISLEVRF